MISSVSWVLKPRELQNDEFFELVLNLRKIQNRFSELTANCVESFSFSLHA